MPERELINPPDVTASVENLPRFTPRDAEEFGDLSDGSIAATTIGVGSIL
jgi:hypothetical protein